MQNIKNESGRSMVEMLGVLAIVGVLTVGAIAGYSTAVTNYKANEVITEAIKRGTGASERVARGIDTKKDCQGGWCYIDLSEFSKQPVFGYHFYDEEYPGEEGYWDPSTHQIILWATVDRDHRPPRRLCEAIKEKSGIGTPVLVTGNCDGNYLEFVFYEDLATHADYCKNHTIYRDWEENPCDHGVVTGCLKNSDCGSNKYCDFTMKSYSPEHGTCKSVDSVGSEEYNIAGIGNLTITTDSLNWYSADNYCKALGKSLIAIDDLGCYLNGQKVVNGSYISEGAVVNPGKRCCNSSSTTLKADYIGECPRTNWEASTSNPGYSSNFYAFGKALHGGSFWTRSRVSNSPNGLYTIFCFNILNARLAGHDYGACSAQSARRAVCK